MDAVVLSLRMVASQGDAGLERAAEGADENIAVLRLEREDGDLSSGLLAGPNRDGPTRHLDSIRRAMRDERKL